MDTSEISEMNESRRESKHEKASSGLAVKIVIIGILTLFLWGTIERMQALVGERAALSSDAQKEVIDKWGGSQLVGRVFLKVPSRTSGKDVAVDHFFAPDTLDIEGQTQVETRSRGLYKIPLYRGQFQMNGAFMFPELKKDLDWSRAELFVVVDDLKGDKQALIIWNGAPLSARRMVPALEIAPAGLAVPVALDLEAKKQVFKIDLTLTGSRSLQFLPYAAHSSVRLKGDWANVRFSGYGLPSRRETSGEGFISEWSFGTLQTLIEREFTTANQPRSFQNLASGADLLLDVYDAVERATKYGLLFIFMTFFALFVLENVTRVRVHPLQYMMIGAAVAIFFLLLLSLAEQIGFVGSYVVASLATIGLIAGYTSSILKSLKRSLALSGFLATLYIYLFVVLRAEDVALLLGSIGLFLFLALAMYMTRDKNWYEVEARAL